MMIMKTMNKKTFKKLKKNKKNQSDNYQSDR